MTIEKIVLVAAFGSLVAMGCSSSDAAGERLDTSDHGAAPADARFTQTVVHLQADGTRHVEIFENPQTTPEGEGSSRGVETKLNFRCLGSALTLWDGPGGVGNSVCLYASPNNDVYIATKDIPYVYTGSTWTGRIRSFAAGTGGNGGRFWYKEGFDGGFPLELFCAQQLLPSDPVTNATECVEATNSIQLYKAPPFGTF